MKLAPISAPKRTSPCVGADGQMMKECPRCGRVLPFTVDFFHRNRTAKNAMGLVGICKNCRNEYTTSGLQGVKNKQRGMKNYHKRKSYFGRDKWNKMERERIKAFYAANPDKYRAMLEGKKRNTSKHRERVSAFLKSPEGKKYTREKARNYRAKAWARLAINLRKRLHGVVTYKAKKNKVGTFENLVGVGRERLFHHIASLWKPGMSWENYGRKKGKLTWHIDHIVPYAHFKEDFDSEDPVRIKKASALVNHYTNLFPMWGPENNSKSDTLPGWVIVMGKTMYSDLHEKAYGISPATGDEPDTEDSGR